MEEAQDRESTVNEAYHRCKKHKFKSSNSKRVPDKVADVSDVHADVEGAVRVRRHGQRVVQVPRAGGIYAEHAGAAQVLAAPVIVRHRAQPWQLSHDLHAGRTGRV